jgi:formate hydrogenlyase subunit 6/NADH:ubiquinone oxidoreductase subunit I
MKVCAPGALSYMEDEAEPLGGRMEIDYALCTECGLCIDACCGKAFNIDKVS